MSRLTHAPRFDTSDAERFGRECFGVDATASPLASERDQNFQLRDSAGRLHLLKIANALEDRDMLEAQNQAMGVVAERTGLCARDLPLSAGVGRIAAVTGEAGASHFVRLLTWIPGVPAGTIPRHSAAYRRDVGRTLGALDRALEGFDHPAAHREFHWDLARGVEVCRARLDMIADSGLREAVRHCVDAFARDDAPRTHDLPRSVIHNDANDFNIIVRIDGDLHERGQRVAGIVDFGDLVHGWTVGDLAVAAAYALLDARDPLAAAADVVRGYHAERALLESEIAVLFGLIRLRLCLSVCMAADQVRQRPGDEYLVVSQRGVARALPLLAGVHPRFAEILFRQACDLPPVRHGAAIRRFFDAHAEAFAPVLGAALRPPALTHLALGVGTPLLGGDPAQLTEPLVTERIFGALRDRGATVGFGGYGEARMVYAAPEFASPLAAPGERRTVHLGIDLFAPAGTPVHAPLDGVVAAAHDNAAWLDYGPVIVLQHATDGGVPFFTLYGHLSRESLEGMQPGRRISRGERIASFGSAGVNGGWTPHLHFQVMTDLLELGTDFPGVARPSERDVWLALCPDPSRLLGIPAELEPPPAQTAAQLLAHRRKRLGANLSVAYRDPVTIVRGAGQYLFDADGRRYLDAYNNVPHVGHAHPRVVRAACEQLSVLNTNTRYLHDGVTTLAERISELLPASLSVCWFVNSGSEANELALRLARAHTRRRNMIVLEAAYHGNTTSLIDLSPYKHAGPGGEGPPGWVHTVPIPDVYRGAHRTDDPLAGPHYAAYVEQRIAELAERGDGLAGFMAESLPSVGGQIVFPPGYLAAVYSHVRAAGGVCIADEVQTGYGRIGTHFWGYEQQGVVPDVVVLGKPMGNGYPIGAVVTTPAIAASFDNGMEFFSTFGGSTVSCAVGLAVLDVVRDERLQAHALAVGERLLAALRPMASRHRMVGDVRGSGLFLGVELVRNRETLEPAAAEASFVVNRMREEGVLLGTDGPYHNVVKIRPPMPFAEGDADVLVATLDDILANEVGA